MLQKLPELRVRINGLPVFAWLILMVTDYWIYMFVTQVISKGIPARMNCLLIRGRFLGEFPLLKKLQPIMVLMIKVFPLTPLFLIMIMMAIWIFMCSIMLSGQSVHLIYQKICAIKEIYMVGINYIATMEEYLRMLVKIRAYMGALLVLDWASW